MYGIKFISIRHSNVIIKIEVDKLSVIKSFKYLESFLHKDGEVDIDVLYRMQVGY